MSFRILAGVLVVALASLAGARSVRAQMVDEEPVGKLTIGGVLGAQFPSMSDVNDNLHVVNNFLVRDELRRLDDVNVALVTGLDVRYKASDRFSVGFAWGGLNSRSEFDVTRAAVRFYSRATTYQGTIYYHVPHVEALSERLQAMVGLGFLYLDSGKVEWRLVDRTTNFFIRDGDISELSGAGIARGTGSGFSLQGGASYMLSSRFSVAADFGYRFAKIKDLTIDPAEVQGYIERFGTGDGTGSGESREPGDWAIWDFFLRDPNAELPDGRKRTDPQVPGEDRTGCAECPLYFHGGPLEVDYSGPFTNISIRLHF